MHERPERLLEVRHGVSTMHVVLKEGAIVRLVGKSGLICVRGRRERYIP